MINIIRQIFKTRLHAVLAILILLLGISLYFNFKPCKTEIIDVVIPEKGGEQVTENPIPVPPQPSKRDTVFIPGSDKYIPVENEVNQKLLNELKESLKYKDSLDIYKRYLAAIKINRYHEVVDNDDVRIDIFAKTTGTLDSIHTKYVVKEQRVPVEVKDTRRANLLLGGGLKTQVDNGFQLNKTHVLGEASYQSKNGNLYTIGGSTDKYVHFTFKTPIFK